MGIYIVCTCVYPGIGLEQFIVVETHSETVEQQRAMDVRTCVVTGGRDRHYSISGHKAGGVSFLVIVRSLSP